MQENIMWLVNSMVDQAESTSVIKVCLENRVVQIISDQISSDKREQTILQTLLTLQALSKEPDLLSQFRESNIFSKLQGITNTSFVS